MDPISRLRSQYDNLTKAEQKLADFILEEPRRILNGNISQISGQADSSNAAMVRMCQKLGYNGFSEFRFSLHRYLLSHGADSVQSTTGSSASNDPIQQIISAYVRYLNQIPSFVTSEELCQIAHKICQARYISIWAFNRTYQSAMHLSNRLCRLGIFNKCVDDYIVMTDDAEIMDQRDLCIIISVAGRGFIGHETLVHSLRKRGCHTLLITMNPKQPIAKDAEQILTLPWISNDPSANFFSANFFEDQIIVYMALELLLYEVAKLYQG